MAISHHTFLAYGDGTWASHLARTGGQHTILKPNGVLVTVNSIGFAVKNQGFHPNIQSSTTHKSQDIEATQVPIIT